MRNSIASIIAIILIAAAPVAVSAQTTGLQAQIDALLEQVRSLQQQLVQLMSQQSVSPAPGTESQGTSTSRWCNIVRTLAQGTAGDDVTDLQSFLRAQGYLAVDPTGYFGPLTAAAVAKWQSAEGVESAGSFGPISRALILRKWCGSQPAPTLPQFSASPASGAAPLTVTFNSWISGFHQASVSYRIDYGDGSGDPAANCYAPTDYCQSPGQNTHTYTSNGTYTATLSRVTDPCPDDGDPTTPRCMAAVRSETIAKVQVVVGPVSSCKPINYMPVACADGSQPQAVINGNGCTIRYECPTLNFTPPANCKAWNDGCNECARTSPDAPAACTLRACIWQGKGYCKSYFDDTNNKSPIISSFSGPSSLAIGETGTWSVVASDPEGGSLTYSIAWGDERVYASTDSASAAPASFTQSTTFTHSYASAGTYTVTIVVQDASGAMVQKNVKVIVGSPSGNQPPVISSVSGPTTLKVGETGTWKIVASDPENGTLTYNVSWGDEGSWLLDFIEAGVANIFAQKTTFTHAYLKAGTYTVSVVVRDSAGMVANTTTTVVIGGSVSCPAVPIVDCAGSNVVSGGTDANGCKLPDKCSPVACTMEYAPVCGLKPWTCGASAGAACGAPTRDSLLTTYSNKCALDAAGATYVRSGACPSSPICWAPPKNGDGVAKDLGTRESPFGEGEATQSIWSSGNQTSTIADASYVCRSGQWKIEGGLPAPSPVVASCTTPWGNKTVANGGIVPSQPYFSNGQYTFSVVVPLMKCSNGKWLTCDWIGNNCS